MYPGRPRRRRGVGGRVVGVGVGGGGGGGGRVAQLALGKLPDVRQPFPARKKREMNERET